MDFSITMTPSCTSGLNLKIRNTILFLCWDIIVIGCYWLNLAQYYLGELIKTKLDIVSLNEITFLMKNMLDKTNKTNFPETRHFYLPEIPFCSVFLFFH